MAIRNKLLYIFAAAAMIIAVLGSYAAFCALDARISAQAFSAMQESRPLVILDAGHGGIDGGATGNGITEKDINLLLAQKTAAFCELFGFGVELTRSGDYSTHDPDAKSTREIKRTDLHNRLSMMTEASGAVAMSIHLNKYSQSSARGAQVFYGGAVEGSRMLAELIQQRICTMLQPENHREIKKADSNLFLLYNNDINPSVMVECGFLSNPQEAQLLKTDDYQGELAFAMAVSLLDFYNRE